MTEGILRDGTGGASRARVGSDHRLWVDSVSKKEITDAADNGQGYIMPTGVYPLAIATETPILRLSMTDSTAEFHINRVLATFNGGDTSHNRAMLVRLYKDMAAPTANAVTFAPGNLLSGSNNNAAGLYHAWTGASTGMTVATNGTFIAGLYVAQGTLDVDFNSAFILQAGAVIGITVECEEAGKGSVVVTGFFDTPT